MEFASHYVYVPPLIEKPKRSGMSFHCPQVHAAELFVCLRVNENDSLWVSACIYTTENLHYASSVVTGCHVPVAQVW